MTEDELMALVLDTPSALVCHMADTKLALLVFNPTETSSSRDFGFQVPGEPGIRWRAAERIVLDGKMLREESRRPLGTPIAELSGRPGHPGFDRFAAIARSWGLE